MRVKKYPWFLSEEDIRFEYDVHFSEIGRTVGAIKRAIENGDEEQLAELRKREHKLRIKKQNLSTMLTKITTGEL